MDRRDGGVEVTAVVMDSLWTTKDVAAFLNVNERTVERLAIPRIRIPTGAQKSLVRFDPSDVRRLKDEWTKTVPIRPARPKANPKQRARAKRRKAT